MENGTSLTISVGELAEIVKGEILNCPEQSGQMVSSLMVGALGVEPTPVYFSQKSDKAVITRGDRTDIQLGALETSTKCLILTGGIKPGAVVISRADEDKVPIILVEKDTPAILTALEEGLSRVEVPVAEASPEE